MKRNPFHKEAKVFRQSLQFFVFKYKRIIYLIKEHKFKKVKLAQQLQNYKLNSAIHKTKPRPNLEEGALATTVVAYI